MEELKKHSFLLTILLALLVAKFAIVPLMEFQETLVAENAQLAKKSQKTERLLGGENSSQEKIEAYSQLAASLDSLVYKSTNESQFKLSFQQEIERILEKNGVSSSNFSWTATTELPELGLTKYQVNVRINGRIYGIIASLSDIEAQSVWHEVDNFNINSRRSNNENLGSSRGARIRINVYVDYNKA